jgi:hypothetical protein
VAIKMLVISFGFGHSNVVDGFGSTAADAFGALTTDVRAATADALVGLAADPLELFVFDAAEAAEVTTDAAVATVFATGAAFTTTGVFAIGAVLIVTEALAVTAGFAAVFTGAGVFALDEGFTVTFATTFDLPLPLVLAVALFTGARRETVLEPAREALAEVTFGIAQQSTEIAHKTRIDECYSLHQRHLRHRHSCLG